MHVFVPIYISGVMCILAKNWNIAFHGFLGELPSLKSLFVTKCINTHHPDTTERSKTNVSIKGCALFILMN